MAKWWFASEVAREGRNLLTSASSDPVTELRVGDRLLKGMKITLAFDVYGTLVDPSGMAKHLADDLGIEAASFADLWREKQLEYSFRRGLMHNYADFSICTSDALNFTCQRFKTAISSERQANYCAYINICRDSTTSHRRFTHYAPPSVCSPSPMVSEARSTRFYRMRTSLTISKVSSQRMMSEASSQTLPYTVMHGARRELGPRHFGWSQAIHGTL